MPVCVEVEPVTQNTKIRAVQTALEMKNRNTLAWKATVPTPCTGSIAAPCLPPPARLTLHCAPQLLHYPKAPLQPPESPADTHLLGPTGTTHGAAALPCSARTISLGIHGSQLLQLTSPVGHHVRAGHQFHHYPQRRQHPPQDRHKQAFQFPSTI